MPACQYLQIILSPKGCSSPLIIWTNCNPNPGKKPIWRFLFLIQTKIPVGVWRQILQYHGVGWGGERSGHRVVFLSQDIVGSISCWCEGEGEVRTQVSRDQYRTDRMINISVGSIFISIIERERGSWTHWTNTVALRWQVSSPPRSPGLVTGSGRRINVARFFSHCLPGRAGAGWEGWTNWNTNSFMISAVTPELGGFGKRFKVKLKMQFIISCWLIPLFPPVWD